MTDVVSARWAARGEVSSAPSPSTAAYVTDLKNDQIKAKGREIDGQLVEDQSRPLSSKRITLISSQTKKENETGWSKSLYRTKPGSTNTAET